jgi:hypothetical protein
VEGLRQRSYGRVGHRWRHPVCGVRGIHQPHEQSQRCRLDVGCSTHHAGATIRTEALPLALPARSASLSR